MQIFVENYRFSTYMYVGLQKLPIDLLTSLPSARSRNWLLNCHSFLIWSRPARNSRTGGSRGVKPGGSPPPRPPCRPNSRSVSRGEAGASNPVSRCITKTCTGWQQFWQVFLVAKEKPTKAQFWRQSTQPEWEILGWALSPSGGQKPLSLPT